MDELNNIFYRPQLEVEKNYYSEGNFPKTQKPVNAPEPGKKPTPLEELLDKSEKLTLSLAQTRDILDVIPDKRFKKTLQDIVDDVIFSTLIEQNKIHEMVREDDEKERVDVYETKEPITDRPTITEDYVDEEDIHWGLPSDNDINITVVKCKSNSELTKEQYLTDSTLIKEDFALKINNAFQDYIYPLMNIMSEAGVNAIEYLNLDYEGETVTGIDKDDMHLNDVIVRNQVALDEKVRLFMKSHSNNNTLSVITAFDTVAQERIRYYEEEYDIAVTNFLDMFKRNILEQTRKIYDNRYFKAKANVYKYLNSTVILTSDMLRLSLDSNSAKCYLLTKDVNIFARKKYESAGYENATAVGANELDPSNKKEENNKKQENVEETT